LLDSIKSILFNYYIGLRSMSERRIRQGVDENQTITILASKETVVRVTNPLRAKSYTCCCKTGCEEYIN